MRRRYVAVQWLPPRYMGTGYRRTILGRFRSLASAVAACERSAARDARYVQTRDGGAPLGWYEAYDARTGATLHSAEPRTVASVGERGAW